MAEKEFIFTKDAPNPGLYSQAVKIDFGDRFLVFLSGQTGNYPERQGGRVAANFVLQVDQALQNIEAVLTACGGKFSDVVRVEAVLKLDETLLDTKSQREAFNRIYELFCSHRGLNKEKDNLPARTMFWVSEIPLEYPTEDTMVEITATAVIFK